MNKELTNVTATDNKTAFTSLLEKYANESKDTTTDTYATTLTDLATAIAYSVLKKCINTGYNETLVEVRNELTRDNTSLVTLAHCNMNAYHLTYNEDGDMIEEVADHNSADGLNRLAHETLGDGIDLVNTAIVAILEETAKQNASGEQVDLERPYTARRLKRKVYIKADDSKAWETVETSPIREIYRTVRREIMASRSMATDPRNGYSYLEELVTDPETGEEVEVYRRLTKYADLGGYATDYNGACTLYSVDRETVDNTESLVSRLNLSRQQAQILKLRQSGHGYKAIATYLGTREGNIYNQLSRITEKVRTNVPELYQLAIEKGYTTE